MIRRPPRSTRTDTLFPYTTLFRSQLQLASGERKMQEYGPKTSVSTMPYPDIERLRSEEHTSELQSLMRISYAVFCLKKKRNVNVQCEVRSAGSRVSNVLYVRRDRSD